MCLWANARAYQVRKCKQIQTNTYTNTHQEREENRKERARAEKMSEKAREKGINHTRARAQIYIVFIYRLTYASTHVSLLVTCAV